ncbi:helix-turn-helix transcriptional regulator [bacterium]|nr:helix-turn-helix transcriptional regulator [bacterium]
MVNFDKNSLGLIFKKYRKRAKLTQEELSEKIDIAEKHYGKLERGVFFPSIETFFRLVEVLNIPLTEFGFKTEIINNLDAKRMQLLQELHILDSSEIDFVLEFISSLKSYNSAIKGS